ncbi:hypothetical protein DH2020_043213 [Rehmannia glutinosa]|uniref:RNase H type-1 domain-containing protein n=1 Tax=Rehmannia glutinosa TaxID=99300 RepID=A0ABR0UL95_REHGL
MWSIWKERNEALWNKSHKNAAGTVRTALAVLNEWCSIHNVRFVEVGDEGHDQQQTKWIKPYPPYFKCNVDASLSNTQGMTSVAMVIRDDRGEFVVARSVLFPGFYQVREAEAIGVREALSWTKNLGLKYLILETDVKYVVDGLTNIEKGMSEYDILLKECQLLLQSKPAFSVTFVRRNGNMVAHALAKEAFSFDSPSVWSSPPLCLRWRDLLKNPTRFSASLQKTNRRELRRKHSDDQVSKREEE